MAFKALSLAHASFTCNALLNSYSAFKSCEKIKVPGLQPQKPQLSKFSVGPRTVHFKHHPLGDSDASSLTTAL